MKMKWFLVISLVIGLSVAKNEECPAMCSCAKSPSDGFTVKCPNIQTLFKYAYRNKQFDAHTIDLSHADIVKVDHNFERFKSLESLDLSFNHIEHINKFLRSCHKLKHLNLRQNNLKSLASIDLPSNIQHVDVSDNFLKTVPSELENLNDLKYLELSGNPIQCNCESLKNLHFLKSKGVTVNDFKCFTHDTKKMRLWTEYKLNEECHKINQLDIMIGDQPADDAEIIMDDTVGKKSLPIASLNELNEGKVFDGEKHSQDDDDKEFMKVENEKLDHSNHEDLAEGSGDVSDVDLMNVNPTNAPLEKLMDVVTEEPEGSGDFDSGLLGVRAQNETLEDDYEDEYVSSGDNEIADNATSTTESFITGHFNPFFMPGSSEPNTTTEEPFEEPPKPTLFQGIINWDAEPSEVPTFATPSTQAPVIEEEFVKTQLNSVEAARAKTDLDPSNTNEDLKEAATKEPLKASTGTIICIVIIIVILASLILMAIIKGQMRKRSDRRIIRQEKVDAEKGDKEMVEMNKSLLGKPAPPLQKKNGNYELVPLQDKKPANGNLGSKTQLNGSSPPPKRNGSVGKLEDATDSPQTIPKVDEPSPTPNREEPESTPQQPLTNGDTSHLAPPSEYVPVYSQESGRVRIKITETPKPKTPVLVTRSRSNAGDIIITPAVDQSPKHKSVT